MSTLRQLREAVRLTQLQLANELGVTPSTIYNWERGRGEPRARQLRQLARIFAITVDELLAAVEATEEQGKDAA